MTIFFTTVTVNSSLMVCQLLASNEYFYLLHFAIISAQYSYKACSI